VEYFIVGLSVVYLGAVIASWVLGRRAGKAEQQLSDLLEHEAAYNKARAEQSKIEAEAQKAKAKIEAAALEPLTQEAVDRLLGKHNDNGKPS
jgi:hypothetical protein